MDNLRRRYYRKRNIIDVSSFPAGDETDDIILCLPKFGWEVARSFLAMQGGWLATFANEYKDNYYLVPDASKFDAIQAIIDETLARSDMSCDLVTALEGINNTLASIAAQDCPTPCGVGAAGSGSTEEPENGYTDDGQTPPDGFDDYSEYDAWKCAIAHLIVDQIMKDLDYIKGLAITKITAEVFAVTMLTPWPFDEEALAIGILTTWALEDALDTILDQIITALLGDYDSLVCQLYLADDTAAAIAVMTAWAATNFNAVIQFFLDTMFNNDNMNRLFQEGNYILAAYDCASCTGGDIDVYNVCLGEVVPQVNGEYTVAMELGCSSGYPGCRVLQIKFDFDGANFLHPSQQYYITYQDTPSAVCPQRGGVDVYFYYNASGQTLATSPTQLTSQPCNWVSILTDGTAQDITFTITPA